VGGKEVELIFAAQPEGTDPAGQSSKFVLPADKLPAEIKDEEDFHGHVHVKIGEKTYGGDVKHDHDHAHEHGKGHEHGKAEGTKPEGAKPEGAKSEPETPQPGKGN
jgi:hypothetical protein